MREIRTSGLMSGDGKQGDAEWPKPLRPSSTLPARITALDVACIWPGEAVGVAGHVFYALLRDSGMVIPPPPFGDVFRGGGFCAVSGSSARGAGEQDVGEPELVGIRAA